MSSLTATPEPANVPPRVLLNLNVADLGPVPTTATIQRRDPDGRTRLVRAADPATLTAGVWQGYDYEAPFGAAVTYEATAGAAVVVSGAVTLDVQTVWLVHPGVPEISVQLLSDNVRALSFATRARPTSRSVFTPLGRTYPLVVTSGARQAPQTELVVRSLTLEQLDALVQILADESVLLLNVPPSLRWGIDHEYISVGDLTENRLGLWGSHEARDVVLPYLVVDRPAGGLQAQFTYADVLANHASYSEVYSRYASYSALLAGSANP